MAYDRGSLYKIIFDLLSQNLQLTLADISDELSVNRHTIETLVREFANVSFRELHTNLILEKAKTLLTTQPRLSIKEIAYSLGYEPRAFARFVKSRTGKTPSELRNRE